MSNREKDPPESQVRILFGRSGGRCAYPTCGKSLVIPSKNRKDQPKNVAKIAHIAAASPGGPRYDAGMEPNERRAESNLILLCGEHHDAVDTQTAFHTVEWMREAKQNHELAMDRAAEYAMGLVGFRELQMVCDGLVLGVTVLDDDIPSIELAIDINEKIQINKLSEETKNLIELGMAQDREVRKFLSTMDQAMIGFSEKVTARFKGLYYHGFAEGLSGDDLFNNIVGSTYANCGPTLTPEVQAASLAVVAHLFSICEIFEHEPITTG